MIATLEGKYRFLSNFWPCFITYEGEEYPSVENAYQAAKCAEYRDRSFFYNCKASEAKKHGRIVRMKPNWDIVKIGIMKDLVKQKFSDPTLKQYLLETKDQIIEEGNWWGDQFWGTCNGIGKNHLGNILMEVRAELRT